MEDLLKVKDDLIKKKDGEIKELKGKNKSLQYEKDKEIEKLKAEIIRVPNDIKIKDAKI